MKKFLTMFTACAALLLSSCNNNNEKPVDPTSKDEDTSIIETSDTSGEDNTSEDTTSEDTTSEDTTTEESSESETSSSEEHQHSYGDWQTVTDPTCTEAGKEERVCACGEKETRDIPALGHEAVTGLKNIKLAEDGSYYVPCSRCGAAVKTAQLQAIDYSKDMSENKWGTWAVSEDGTALVGDNQGTGDQQYVTNLYVEEGQDAIFDFHLKVESTQAARAFALGAGIANKADPGATWMGIDINFDEGYHYSKIWGHDMNQDQTKAAFVDFGLSETEGGGYDVRIEILRDGWVSFYVNKTLVACAKATYDGGYISFNTWQSKATITNFKYYIGAEFNLYPGMYTVSDGKRVHIDDMSEYKWGTWDTAYENLMIHANNGSGDVFYVSNTYFDKDANFIYEVDMKTTDTAGITFGHQAKDDPGASWICQNTNWDSSKSFQAGGANPVSGVSEVYKLYEHKFANSLRHIRIEVTGEASAKNFKFYAGAILVQDVTVSGYNGGYLGFMTWNGEAHFINPTYTLIA